MQVEEAQAIKCLTIPDFLLEVQKFENPAKILGFLDWNILLHPFMNLELELGILD